MCDCLVDFWFGTLLGFICSIVFSWLFLACVLWLSLEACCFVFGWVCGLLELWVCVDCLFTLIDLGVAGWCFLCV